MPHECVGGAGQGLNKLKTLKLATELQEDKLIATHGATQSRFPRQNATWQS